MTASDDAPLLAYETPGHRRDVFKTIATVINVVAGCAWLGVTAALAMLCHQMSESPGPWWLEYAFGGVFGAILLSPVFGVALLFRRFRPTRVYRANRAAPHDAVGQAPTGRVSGISRALVRVRPAEKGGCRFA